MSKLKGWLCYFEQLWNPVVEVQEWLNFDYLDNDDDLGADNQPYVEHWMIYGV